MTIEVLSEAETTRALKGRTVYNETLNDLAEALTPLVDTNGSVWAEGLTEATVNMLRTKMLRKGVKVSARKVVRGGVEGRILLARSASA